MWIFCCGMVRSGSTLQFQITAHLVERAGLGKRVEWVEPEHFPELRGKYSDYSGWKVLKTHACTEEMVSEFEQRRAKGVYIFRDVRDVFVSNMSKSSRSFAQLWDERLLDFCLSTFQQWTSLPGVLISRYEEVIADLPTEVERIADHLGIPADLDACKAIASDYSIGKQLERVERFAGTLSPDEELSWDATYDPRSLLHIDHIVSGTSGQWQDALLPGQVALIQSRAGEWLLANGYELADTPSVLEPLVEQLNQESERLETCEADRASRLEVIHEQGGRLGELEAERNDLQSQLTDLREQFEGAEADRASRLEVIHEQGGRLGELEAERNDLQSQLTHLREQFEGAEADRAARLEIVWEQGRRLGELEGERNDLRAQLTDLREQFEGAEADRGARLETIREHGRLLGDLEGERNDLRAQLDELHQRFEAVEADRAARLEVIQAQGQRLGELEQTLRAISQSRTYRLLRRVGPWAQVERTVAQLTPGAGSSGPQAGTVLPVDYYSAIREPKRLGGVCYDPEIINNIIEGLRSFGYEVQPYEIDMADYRAYFHRAEYEDRYPNYYSSNLPEKSLEHYIAARLLDLNANDVYIDVASEGSPVPEIYGRLLGCTTYRQDLAYPEGLNRAAIGGDAANMPIPDGFATKMALHCSFEHFEGDSDIRFIKEINRVLRPGGAVCIIPLYLFDEYVILTDPTVSVPQEVEFEDDATIYCDPTWGNRHARFYDPAHLMERVHNHLNGMTMKIYRVSNAKEVDPSCYVGFAALITRP